MANLLDKRCNSLSHLRHSDGISKTDDFGHSFSLNIMALPSMICSSAWATVTLNIGPVIQPLNHPNGQKQTPGQSLSLLVHFGTERPSKKISHSYRRISTGSSFDAALAGINVATTEIASDTAVIQTPSARLGWNGTYGTE